MIKIKTLVVHREFESTYNQISVLKTLDGKVKAIINGYINQPKKNTKTIVVNKKEYRLDWSNT